VGFNIKFEVLSSQRPEASEEPKSQEHDMSLRWFSFRRFFTLYIWNSRSLDFRREFGPFVGHDMRQQIIHYGNFSQEGFQVSHLKLPKPVFSKRIWTVHRSWHTTSDHSLWGFSSRIFSGFTFESLKEPKTRSPGVNIDHPLDGTHGDRSVSLPIFLWEVSKH